MKIISCNIANFGKLHDRTFSFEEGLNRMTEPNGWGKSTLTAFIKAMLYGFDGDNKRDELSSERKRYNPWQGGTYGGSMSFEAGGKRYLVSRTFGTRPAGDTFELRDLDTNLPSADLGENIGEELFKINSDSFARTVLIRQNESALSGATDDINAKLGNISDSMDLNCFATIESKIKDELNSLSESKKTGEIYKLKSRATETEALIRSDSDAEDAAKTITLRIDENKAELDALKEEDHKLNGLREKLALYEKKKTDRENYEHLLKEHSEKEASFLKAKAALGYTGTGNPGEDIAKLMGQISRLSELRRVQAGFELTEEEKAKLTDYRSRIPSFDETGRKADRLSADLIAGSAAKREQRSREEEIGNLEFEYENVHTSRKRLLILLSFAMLLLFAGTGLTLVYILTESHPVLLMAGLASGIVGWVLLIVYLFRNSKLKKHGAIIRSRIDRAAEEMAAVNEKEEAVLAEVRELLNSAGILFDRETAVSDLKRLYEECFDHARLSDKYERFKKNDRTEECNELSSGIRVLFNDFGLKPDEADQSAYVNSLTIKNAAYESEKGLFDDVCRRLSEFEKGHDIRELSRDIGEDPELSVTQIRERQAGIDARSETLEEALKLDRNNLEALKERIGSLEDNVELLAELKGEIEAKRERVSLLTDTMSYLSKAKETLTARYIGPLQRGFSEYYSVITGRDAEGYMMDANTELTVNEAGIQHSVALLSSGYKDLVGLSMRLSFSDAMYPGEKPMLILDDPFVNLDSVNYEGGLRLLDYVSEKYQVLYFTCR